MHHVKECRHVVRKREFDVSGLLAGTVNRLLDLVVAESSFTGNVTIHVFRGAATLVVAEDRAALNGALVAANNSAQSTHVLDRQ